MGRASKRRNDARNAAVKKSDSTASSGVKHIEDRRYYFKKIVLSIVIIFFGIGCWFFLLTISNKKFNAIISSADSIEFNVKLQDTLMKTPLCNCPNSELSNSGFLSFFKNTSIINHSDTSTFTVTAPSSDNFNNDGSYRFRIKISLYKKPILENFESGDWQKDVQEIKKLEKIYEEQLNNVYFLSLIKKGKLKVRFASENVISSLLPAQNSKIGISSTKDSYTDSLSAVTINYKTDYGNQGTGNVFMDFFGPRIEIIADSTVNIYGKKGPVFPLINFYKSRSRIPYETIALIEVDVPFKARIGVGDWDDTKENYWEQEMQRLLPRDVKYIQMLFNIPLTYINKAGQLIFYDFKRDAKAYYQPAIFAQSRHAVDFKLEDALSEAEFSKLKEKCNAEENIFKSSSYPYGVTVRKVVPLSARIPDSLDKQYSTQLNQIEKDVSFRNTRQKLMPLLKNMEKFGFDTLEPLYDKSIDIVFYYPHLQEHNGIYYFGSLDSVNIFNANLEYSYGISSNQKIKSSTLRLNNIVPTIDSPYYYKMPIDFRQFKDGSQMQIAGEADMILNNEIIGTSIFENRYVNNLTVFFGVFGITIIGLAKYFRQMWKDNTK